VRKIWNNEIGYIESLRLTRVDNVNDDIDIKLGWLDFIRMNFSFFHNHPEGLGAE
jgi:hypothetical protein